MNIITKHEFDLTHRSDGIGEEEFLRMAQCALDLTEELCFGRAAKNEPEARRAMKEMISFWIERGGLEAVYGNPRPKSETVGNYSVTNGEETVPLLQGVSVSPYALLILNRAGLRDHGV